MTAIVTGGSRGIGLAIAEALLADGFKVLAAARSENESTARLQKIHGGDFLFCPCDIALAQDRECLLEMAAGVFGGVDLLVNNAGVAPKNRRDMLDISLEEYHHCMDINLEGAFFLTQAAAKMMLAQGGGRVVNISSVSSYAASVNRAEYCLSKAGISMMTKLFAARLAGDGISVFEVSPGIIETDMTAAVREQYAARIADGLTPVKRLGTPEDVAACVLSLARGQLDFCTGTVIHADGGFSVQRL
ncbi:MAG: 3-ketoacyl-ACP reductase [Oscillospiraceae bacterium]|nr:3-ketoacyl-ACP reductase [Oscillospiraceae bacterium]